MHDTLLSKQLNFHFSLRTDTLFVANWSTTNKSAIKIFKLPVYYKQLLIYIIKNQKFHIVMIINKIKGDASKFETELNDSMSLDLATMLDAN